MTTFLPCQICKRPHIGLEDHLYVGDSEAPQAAAPLVSLNGTHGPDLLEGYLAAAAALREARAALVKETIPHPRDYPDKEGVHNYQRAREAHLVRLARLDMTIAEFEALAMGVSDQIDTAEGYRVATARAYREGR